MVTLRALANWDKFTLSGTEYRRIPFQTIGNGNVNAQNTITGDKVYFPLQVKVEPVTDEWTKRRYPANSCFDRRPTNKSFKR